MVSTTCDPKELVTATEAKRIRKTSSTDLLNDHKKKLHTFFQSAQSRKCPKIKTETLPGTGSKIAKNRKSDVNGVEDWRLFWPQ